MKNILGMMTFPLCLNFSGQIVLDHTCGAGIRIRKGFIVHLHTSLILATMLSFMEMNF